MRGAPHTYAVNGHSRTWTISEVEGQKPEFVALISIGSNDAKTHVGRVVLDITRAQAAAILREHHTKGHVMEMDMQHSEHCLCAPDDVRKVPHYMCAYGSPCQQKEQE